MLSPLLKFYTCFLPMLFTSFNSKSWRVLNIMLLAARRLFYDVSS